MPEKLVCLDSVLQAIDKEREKWKQHRVSMGLHANEQEKFRRERWESTQMRLQTLKSVREEIVGSLPVFQDLMCRKSLFSFIFESALIEGGWFEVFMRRGLPQTAEVHRNKQVALNELLVTLSGNAGKQPLTRETESLGSTGKSPVTVPTVPRCADELVALFGSSLPSIVTDDLKTLSEAVLDELERRGEADSWSLTHRGVGEGDLGLGFDD